VEARDSAVHMGFSRARCRFQKVPSHHPAVTSKTMACHVITQSLFLKKLACHVITQSVISKTADAAQIGSAVVSKNADII
jgi:hypothetical protein